MDGGDWQEKGHESGKLVLEIDHESPPLILL
jgi:hypothetical protein